MLPQGRRRASYADIKALPPHVVGEIIAGELIVSPRPAPLHARASSQIGGSVIGPFDNGVGGPGGWWILFEPELHLQDDVVVPDLAGWRREHMPHLPNNAYFELAPDWLCEVLSSSTQAIDRSDKMNIYAREGVKHVWLIDPLAMTLEAYRRLEDGGWRVVVTHRGPARIRVEPFEAVELDLAKLWER